MARGALRVYLGAAPGVGKTYAMLDEGHRRRERGADVVIGIVETHGRAKTVAQLRDLEVVPRRAVPYRDTTLEEMDVDAILCRRPAVALVDELAHTNAPGSRNAKRWQDVQELLAAGVDVVTTVNVQHLESLNDVVESITGVTQRETVPDAVVRGADQIELVDMSPEALRRRMEHGNIYPAERAEAALANYFRPGNLGALRELALLWAADRVEEALDQYRIAHGITDTWETRERVVVAITGAPAGERLVRRAARIAARTRGELVGVHVVAGDGLRGPAAPDALERHRDLVTQLGGAYHEVVGDDVGRAVVDFARSQGATQLVLGASRRPRLVEVFRGSVVGETVRQAKGIDVHVIATAADDGPVPERRRWRSAVPLRRQLGGWCIVVLGLPLLTALLVGAGDSLSLATDLLVFLTVVVAAGAVGGPLPGLTGAVAGSLLVNFFLVPPVHTFTIADRENVVAIVVFVAVAAVVSVYVHLAARRELDARRARAEVDQVVVARKADELRTALLRAVSHDLRTPLAGIKASVTSLLSNDVEWEPAQRDEFLTTIDAETDRLTRLVGNLLDMSRLQAGAMSLHVAPTSVADVVASALASLSSVPAPVAIDVADDLPPVLADPELLERAVANLIGNAATWARPSTVVDVEGRLDGGLDGGVVRLRIVDRGPGIPADGRDAALRPFQRLGDGGGAGPAGVGLGLALASGFVAAMGGRFELADTPGGGLTVEISLPVDRSRP